MNPSLNYQMSRLVSSTSVCVEQISETEKKEKKKEKKPSRITRLSGHRDVRLAV